MTLAPRREALRNHLTDVFGAEISPGLAHDIVEQLYAFDRERAKQQKELNERAAEERRIRQKAAAVGIYSRTAVNEQGDTYCDICGAEIKDGDRCWLEVTGVNMEYKGVTVEMWCLECKNP